MKISKRVREEAAMICQVCASNGTGTWESEWAITGSDKALSAEGTPAGNLARLALAWAPGSFFFNESYACAESMLRTGWSP